MPYFMNNQGNCVVPTLETLAMLADGLTEDKLRHLPPLLQELTQDMHRRVDFKVHGSDGLPAVYLASDTTDSDTPCRSMEVNLSRNSFAKDTSFKCSAETEAFNSRQVAEWTRIKQVVTSRLGDIEAVIYVDERRCHFLRLRPGRGTKVALEITPYLFNRLVADSVDLGSVKRLFMEHSDYGMQVRLSSLPGLTSLDYIVTDRPQFDVLVSLRHTLRELRIIFDLREFDNSENFRPQVVLQQLSKLNLLFLTCDDYANQPRLEIDSWELPSSVRSLGIQCFQRLKAVNIIRFLTREVDYKGNKFARQALLDDLTIIHAKDGVMNEVYRSKALTRRMKERIYSDLDSGHYVAASKLLAARHENTFVIRPDDVFNTVGKIIDSNTCFSWPIDVVMCEHMQYIKKNSHRRLADLSFCHRDVHQQDKGKILKQKPVVLRHLVDAYACLQFTTHSRDDMPVNKAKHIRYTADLLKLLDRRQVIASNIPRYLAMVIALMISPRDRDLLLSLFMKHFNQLTQLEQGQVIRDNVEKLICFFVCLIVIIPAGKMHKKNISEWGLKDKVLLTSQLVEMITITRKLTKNKKLAFVCNVVLRRFMEGSVSGKWKDASWASVKEKPLITKLFPGLVKYFRIFKKIIGHVAKI